MRGIFVSPKSNDDKDEDARDFRIKALQGFMLSISDQQLVTGFATLLAGWAQYSSITVYSMNIVSGLAFFAFSVHIATLNVLVGYLRKHNVVKGGRIVVMIVSLIMLILILVLQMSATWYFNGGYSDLFVCCAVLHFTLTGTGAFGDLSSIFVTIFLIIEYGDKVVMLYSKDGKSSIADVFLKWWRGRYGMEEGDNDDVKKYREWAKRIDSESAIQSGTLRQSLVGLRIAESFAFHQVQDSQASAIGWLLFANIYGTAQIIVYRGQSEATTGPFNTMGFGQVVPLALLILPVFTAVESIYGMWFSFRG